MADPEQLIAQARAETVRLVESLTRQWNAIVEASTHTTNDDEHDPEGATIAFERAQVQDMLRTTKADLADLDIAVERLHNGTYDVCERCGADIGEGRLTARPAARTCITCANRR
jgi:DnaK suppressor protein